MSPELLDNCDVLIWWGHKKHTEVPWEKARDIARRIKEGKLSLFVLHSAHWSRPFIEAMCERAREDAIKSLPAEQRATAKLKEIPPVLNALPAWDAQLTPNVSCVKKWDEPVKVTLKMPSCVFPYVTANGKPSHIFTLLPDHPIAQGVPHEFVSTRPRIMPSRGTCPSRMRWCSKSTGSRAIGFAAAACGKWGKEKCSISARARDLSDLQESGRPADHRQRRAISGAEELGWIKPTRPSSPADLAQRCT